ncbi:hypothetical protein DV737_g2032, partial [Chaetothyriales sp. CBS 132003]
MARTQQQQDATAARIYEDPEPARANMKTHSRAPSVGDILRGRKKHASPEKQQGQYHSPSPLGERHVNSPPPGLSAVRVPLRQEDVSRPSMHKKTGSSVSLKELIMGGAKDSSNRSGDSGSHGSPTAEAKPQKSAKKTKSSTNLASLLKKKKSKRDLHEDEPTRDQENVSPNKKVAGMGAGAGAGRRALWEQLATQPLQDAEGLTRYPQALKRTVEAEMALYTPKDYSEFRPHEQRNFYGCTSIAEMRSKFEGQCAPSPLAEPKERSRSRVLEALSTLGGRSKESAPSTRPNDEARLSGEQLDSAFEAVLEARNIPHNMRDTMRNLKPELKAALMRGDRSGSECSRTCAQPTDGRQRGRSATKRDERPKSEEGCGGGGGGHARSRSRPRSGILTLSKRDDSSPTKRDKSTTRPRSKSRPKSVDLSALRPTSSSRSMASPGSVASLATADSAATPGDFIHYFHEVQKPSLIEVGKLHKLRILLRNESVNWTDHFVRKGGMNELVSLLYRISKIEWREEHEDHLLHETLLCLKALCTTELALHKFGEIEDEFFPTILNMLFDPERKGPSEFSTRGVIVSLLFAHLSAMQTAGSEQLERRARKVLFFLQDCTPEKDKQLLDFVSQMHTARPYRIWCKEVVNVTKDVFWIFLHHFNVAHFPAPRPPHPAAPYVGGVEWEATQYLALHLDLLNGLIASLPSVQERNRLRAHLEQSGWEKVMGSSLRTCKEKFYAGVHDGLKVWVAAANADGWPVEDVRAGPPREESARKSPVRAKVEPPPKISFDVDVGALPKVDDAWLGA